MEKKIALGCDHAGFPLKIAIFKAAAEEGYEITDFGTFSADSVDYPDFVHPVCKEMEAGKAEFGILLCGSGNGVAMTANKHRFVRAALCWTEEIAVLARKHNNANALCIPVRFVSEETAIKIFKGFLNTSFEAGRHQARVEKMVKNL